jgi:hypothetical protein
MLDLHLPLWRGALTASAATLRVRRGTKWIRITGLRAWRTANDALKAVLPQRADQLSIDLRAGADWRTSMMRAGWDFGVNELGDVPAGACSAALQVDLGRRLCSWHCPQVRRGLDLGVDESR